MWSAVASGGGVFTASPRCAIIHTRTLMSSQVILQSEYAFQLYSVARLQGHVLPLPSNLGECRCQVAGS
jgi:hypothetical protein